MIRCRFGAGRATSKLAKAGQFADIQRLVVREQAEMVRLVDQLLKGDEWHRSRELEPSSAMPMPHRTGRRAQGPHLLATGRSHRFEPATRELDAMRRSAAHQSPAPHSPDDVRIVAE